MRILENTKYKDTIGRMLYYGDRSKLWESKWLSSKTRLRLVKTNFGKDLIILGYINSYFSNNSYYIHNILNPMRRAEESLNNYKNSNLEKSYKEKYADTLGFLDIPYSFAINYVDEPKKLVALLIIRNRWAFATGEYRSL